MYITLNEYLKKEFGTKVYKLALSAATTCPNRDGTVGKGGCIFCGADGSGSFAAPVTMSVTEQIEIAKARIKTKIHAEKFIAYFQSFTNTYAPIDYLERVFFEAISHPQVVVLSIATRPDCLPIEVLELLNRLNRIKPVWVELGLQTIHVETAKYIRRGYPLSCYDTAVENLNKIGVKVITHSPERAADLFDKVIVLAKSTKDNCGHLAFFGGVREAFDFFGVSSFREIVKKINRSDENGEGLSDYFIEKYQSLQGGAL